MTEQDDEVVDAEVVEDEHPVPAAPVELVPLSTAPRTVSALQAIRESLADLDLQRIRLEEEGDYTNLAYGAADCAAVNADLSQLVKDARLSVARVLDAKWETEHKMKYRPDGSKRVLPQEDIEGLGRVKVKGGSERKDWESEKLLRRLIYGAMVDADGVILNLLSANELADRIFDAVFACVPITASLGWRVGQEDKATGEWSGLRGQGIDPDEYCERIDKDRVAEIPKRAEGEAFHRSTGSDEANG